VRVRFLDHPVGTELELIHERVAAAAREIHEGGWKGCLDGLERLALDRDYDKAKTLRR
jgi:hypothetical protein